MSEKTYKETSISKYCLFLKASRAGLTTMRQAKALLLISLKKGIDISQLSELCESKVSSVVAACERLEELGLIHVTKMPRSKVDCRMKNTYEISPKGRKFIQNL